MSSNLLPLFSNLLAASNSALRPAIANSQKVATGDVIVVRYADDLVAGFENRMEAERFLKAFRDRLAKSDWNYIQRKRD